ncbi:MAG: HAMP domain-containing histidine kinase [Bacteroides sp.]|nr:HAMP domain-containing histidine kinase [Bacteroides sp.]
MKTLLSKNLRYFLRCTALILLGCFPLLYVSMHFFYAKDLDELIEYRARDFRETYLPGMTLADVDTWNRYNEDLQILDDAAGQPTDKYLRQSFYNRAEGHPVDYRVIYTRLVIDDCPFLCMSRIPMIEPGDLLGMLVSQYAVLFAVLLLLLAWLQRRIARKLWVPFYHTLAQVEQFRLERGTVPVFGETDVREFARLNKLLEELIINNLETYNRQKEFIQNASHELQTPLAVFQSQLDLLLQEPELTEEQGERIRSLYDVSSRLTRLNRNLLLLARIENAQFRDTEWMDVGEVVRGQLCYLLPVIENEGLTLESSLAEGVRVKGNRTLLESLVGNLLTNAIRHNTTRGKICLTLADSRLTVSNTGEPQPLDGERIFQRFSRTDERRKGNGLGLAISRSICTYHGWCIAYEYRKPLHVFVVEFEAVDSDIT